MGSLFGDTELFLAYPDTKAKFKVNCKSFTDIFGSYHFDCAEGTVSHSVAER